MNRTRFYLHKKSFSTNDYLGNNKDNKPVNEIVNLVDTAWSAHELTLSEALPIQLEGITWLKVRRKRYLGNVELNSDNVIANLLNIHWTTPLLKNAEEVLGQIHLAIFLEDYYRTLYKDEP